MTATFQREYLLRLPLPLAQLYARAHNAKEARARHDNAFYLFEALVKLAATPAVACYLHECEQGQPRDPALDRLLAQLALPSLGQWLAIFRALARHFGQRADAASHPLGHVWGQLDEQRRDRPAVLDLYRRIKNGPDGAPAGDASCSLLQLFEALVQYRNGVFGHGGPRFEPFYEKDLGPLLFPAATEVLAEGAFEPLGPRDSRLVYLVEQRVLDDGTVEVGVRELVGAQGERAAGLRLTTAQAAALVPGRVAVLWPGRPVPLRLDPLLVYRESELAEEVLFLNRDRHGRQVEYLSYTTGRTERDRATAPALAALLSRVANRNVSEADLQALAEQSQAATPSVEALMGPAPPSGRMLGEYELLAELGRGGMGVVYLARQSSLGRLVALKTLPADLAGEAVALARFRREIRALARCEHPNIVKVLSSGSLPDGQLYYTMEYVPGCDLEQVWRELSGTTASTANLSSSSWAQAVLSASRKKREQSTAARQPEETATDCRAEVAATKQVPALLPPLPDLPALPDDPGGYVRRVATLVRDAARAVQAVHEQGLIHRDIKPANLMLTPDGARVVLMDFGLAKGADDSTTASRRGGLMGTLRYAAPEQLAAASLDVGPTADVRGLGVTLWELLSRRRLFAEAADERQLAALVHDVDLPKLRAIEPGLDRDLEAIVARATERRPSARIGSAGRLAEYLQLYLDGKSLPIRPPGVREQLWRWLHRRKGLVTGLAATGAALALAVTLAVVLWVQRRELAREVTRDLEEAAQLRDQARWREGRAVLKRAEDRLTGRGPEALEEQVRQARQDLDLVIRLEEIPFLAVETIRFVSSAQGKPVVVPGTLDINKTYAEIFRGYGIDVLDLGAEEASRRVVASAVRGPLVVALDLWSFSTTDPEIAKRLQEVAELADADDWRREVRRAVHRDDRRAVEGLAAQLEAGTAPPITVRLLALQLQRYGALDRAEAVLRRGQQQHPGDFWLNYYLFEMLSNKPGHLEEALGFLRATLAVRPESSPAHLVLGLTLFVRGSAGAGETECREAIRLQPDFGLAHLALGACLMGQDRFAEAADEFHEAIRLQPDLYLAHLALGLTLNQDHKPAEAERALQKAVHLNPNDPQGLNELGNALYAQQKWAEAEAAYLQAISRKDGYPEAHVNLGHALYAQKKFPAAEEAYKKAARLRANYPEAHLWSGNALYAQQKFSAAEEEYREAVRLQTNHTEARCGLGNALYAQKKYPEAEAEYLATVGLKPNYPAAHYNLGNARYEQKNYPAAAAAYSEAVRLQADYPEARRGLGNALYEQKKYPEAEAEYRKAISLRPNYAEAHVGLGNALNEQKKYPEAVVAYREAVRLRDNYPEAYYRLCLTLSVQKKFPEAEAAGKKALDLKHDYPEAHLGVGLALYFQKKTVEAEAEYRTAIRLSPAYPGAHFALGLVFLDRMDPAAAEAEFQLALLFNPDYFEARYALGTALQAQCKFSEALQEYERSRQLLPSGDFRLLELLTKTRQCQRLADLDAKLPDLCRGSIQPVDASEGLTSGWLCQQPYKRMYVAAARLYADAFSADSQLVEDPRTGNRYNAACAAALAGCGQGNDARLLDDKDGVRLRRQALGWLRTDLDAWAKLLDGATPEQRAQFVGMLKHWQEDSDLAGVREADGMAKLPEDERSSWAKLWTDVDDLLKRERAKPRQEPSGEKPSGVW
jgi:tetratricopeptide (TPR) repeat protein/serine/threonine protein kinase